MSDHDQLIAAAVAGVLDQAGQAELAGQAARDPAVRTSLRLHLLIDEIAAQELAPARGAAAFAAGLEERRRAADDGFAFLARVRSRLTADDRVRAALTAPTPSMPLRLVRVAPWWPAAAAAAAALALLLLGSGGGTAVAAEPAPASSVMSQAADLGVYRRPEDGAKP